MKEIKELSKWRNKIQRDRIREDLRKIEEQFRSCVYNYQKLQRDET